MGIKEIQKIAMEKHLQIAQKEILTTFYNSTVTSEIDFSIENIPTVEDIAQITDTCLRTVSFDNKTDYAENLSYFFS